MKVFNTLSRKLEELAPLEPGHVRLYTCGPTVYNYAHIGNFRAYVFEDLLRRQLKFAGFKVTQVMNLTDVDDKTIRGANEQGISLDAYTRPFKDAFFSDLQFLNIEKAEHYPAATDHVEGMIRIIQTLITEGLAYVSEDGSVYYNVAQFSEYGKLAGLDRSALRSGARVAQDEYEKESVADFAVWKAWDASDGDVAWDSPWGRGRPGWHIECSAMSMQYLGESFDLHTGGVDNIFPHHENEIAQSEGATGRPFVRYWMHCGYLVVNGAKMSKSSGNFYTLRDLVEKGYTGREIRYLLLSAHYRQPLNFTLEGLDAARAALGRLDDFRDRLARLAGEADPGALPEWAVTASGRFKTSMNEDLDTPPALAALFDLVHEGNRRMDADAVSAGEARAVLDELNQLDQVLGVFDFQPDDEAEPVVLQLLKDREAARASKDWAEADRLRDEIQKCGWEIRDTAEGAVVKPRR